VSECKLNFDRQSAVVSQLCRRQLFDQRRAINRVSKLPAAAGGGQAIAAVAAVAAGTERKAAVPLEDFQIDAAEVDREANYSFIQSTREKNNVFGMVSRDLLAESRQVGDGTSVA